MPTYNAPTKDMQFLLHEVLEVSRSSVPGYGELEADFTGAVLEEALHRALAQVQIDDRHRAPGVQQAGHDVDGQGGLARPALFVADHDDTGLAHDFSSPSAADRRRLISGLADLG